MKRASDGVSVESEAMLLARLLPLPHSIGAHQFGESFGAHSVSLFHALSLSLSLSLSLALFVSFSHSLTLSLSLFLSFSL